MNRFLQIFNLFGICALAVLCCFQWNTNRQFHLKMNALQAANQQQAATIDEQSRTIRGQLADLDDFRHRLSQANADLNAAQVKLAGMTAERDRLSSEREQLISQRDRLQVNLNQWITAVSARDALIRQASEQILQLVRQRNDAILRFNSLAEKYSVLVKQISTTRP